MPIARFFCFAILSGILLNARGSDTLSISRTRQFFNDPGLFNIWLNSSNPAGFDFTSIRQINMLTVGYIHDSRQLKSPVEPGVMNQLSIRTKGLKRIGKLTFNGSFGYENDHYGGILYNNTMIFDVNIPYILGDTVTGKQRKEGFYLNGGFSYPLTPKLIIGLKADYSNYVGAKLKDPRNLNNISFLNITPGFIYKSGKLAAGISGGPVIFNNEISVSVNENAKYSLFQFMGLGYYKSIRNIYSYSNSYFGKGYQAEAQLSYGNHFLTAHFRSYSEDVRYDNTFRLFDGISDRVTVGVNEYSSFKQNNLLHRLHLRIGLDQVSGTEFFQYYENKSIGYYRYNVIVTKSMAEEKHVYTDYNGAIEYSIAGYRGIDQVYMVDAGIAVDFQTTTHYPVSNYGSNEIFTIVPALHFTRYFLFNSLTLIPQAGVEYRACLAKDMTYTITNQSIKDFADRDYSFRNSEYLKGSAGVQLLKRTGNKVIPEYFIDLNGSYMHVPANSEGLKHNFFINSSIGLIF